MITICPPEANLRCGSKGGGLGQRLITVCIYSIFLKERREKEKKTYLIVIIYRWVQSKERREKENINIDLSSFQ